MYARLFQSLNEAGVDYLVLGGSAVCLHGFARMTTDIDILLENSPGNISRFIAAASKWGEGHAAELAFDDFQGPGAVRIVEEFPLDVFTLVDGRTYESFAVNATKHTIAEGIIVPSFSIADLIEVKAKTLREKDQLDVTVLRRLQTQTTPTPEPVIFLEPRADAPSSAEPETPPS